MMAEGGKDIAVHGLSPGATHLEIEELYSSNNGSSSGNRRSSSTGIVRPRIHADAASHPLGPRSLLLAVASLNWCYAFFQRAAPSSFIQDLQRDFDMSASGAGTLASAYFFTYSLVTVFIGPLFDRHGALRVLMVSTLGCTLGSVVFTVPALWCAYLGRLLVGLFCAGSWLCCVAISAKCFPTHSDSLVGFAFFGGMAGGALAQTPLVHTIAALGGSWRAAMRLSACVPLACGAVVMYLAYGHPWLSDLTTTAASRSTADSLNATGFPELRTRTRAAGQGSRPAIILGDFLRVMQRGVARCCGVVCPRELVDGYLAPRNWMFLSYGLCTFSVLLGFTSLWSTPYLIAVGGYSPGVASIISAVTNVSIGCATPAWGRVSDKHNTRRAPMIYTAAIATASMAVLVFAAGPVLHVLGATVVIYAVIGGAFGAHSILAYSVVRRCSEADGRGVGVDLGIFNLGTVVSGALFQPLVGVILDASWQGEKDADGTRVYDAGDYMKALSVFPAAYGLCVVLLALCFPPDDYKGIVATEEGEDEGGIGGSGGGGGLRR